MDDRGGTGIGKEVAQFIRPIAEVHVERDRAQLDHREECLEVFRAVHHVEADGIAARHPVGRQSRSDRVRARIELGIGQAQRIGDDRHALGHGGGDGFEEVGKVELVGHRSVHRCRIFWTRASQHLAIGWTFDTAIGHPEGLGDFGADQGLA